MAWLRKGFLEEHEVLLLLNVEDQTQSNLVNYIKRNSTYIQNLELLMDIILRINSYEAVLFQPSRLLYNKNYIKDCPECNLPVQYCI